MRSDIHKLEKRIKYIEKFAKTQAVILIVLGLNYIIANIDKVIDMITSIFNMAKKMI